MRIVGRAPWTCRAKFAHLMTSTDDTKESMTRASLGELSIEIAFALPLTMMVVLLHRLMRMEWEMEASISTGWDSLS